MSDQTDAIIARLKAAGEPTRLRILALLQHGDLAVGELTRILGISQPRLSQQMKVLGNAGLVTRLPEGSWVFYRAVPAGPAGDVVRLALSQVDLEASPFVEDVRQLKSIEEARAQAAAEFFDSVARTWDTVRALHYPNQAIEKALLDEAGPGPFKNIIDIGTGTGRMLTLFAGRTASAEGLDLSHQMLTVARNNLARANVSNASVRQGDACATPFGNNSADLVIIHQVLHFVDQPARVLAEADRILEPGGRLLIVDFAPHSLEFLRDEHGHRRMGVSEDALRDWASETRLHPNVVRRFTPPDANQDGLSVMIWSAEKPLEVDARRAKESAA